MPRCRSKTWRYFKKITMNTAKCDLCGKLIRTCGDTTNMIKHLEKHGKRTGRNDNEPKESELPVKSHWLKRNNADNTETSYAGAGTSQEPKVEINENQHSPEMYKSPVVGTFQNPLYNSDRQAQILDAILYFICIDLQPFNIIENEGFQHFMREMSLHQIPDKDAIKRRCDEKYDTVAEIFKQKLKEILHMTITIDTWSGAGSRSFLGVTVHFIANETRKMESGNIEVIELFENTADYISCAIRDILQKWCIDTDKITAVVMNTESNVIDAVTETLNQNNHIICFAHTINSIAEKSIKNCKGLDNIVNKVKSVVEFVKSNTDLTNEIYQRQIDLNILDEISIKELILDFEMKWNSIFYMIERFVELWNDKVIDEVLFMKHKYPEMLSADEFVTLKEILDVLKPLEFVAQECSTEKYIIISKVIPLIKCTMTEYQSTRQTMELSMRLKEAILAEIERCFGNIEYIYPISIATILDPRFKTVHFQDPEALFHGKCVLRKIIRNLPNLSDEVDTEQEETKYNLWIHHKNLTIQIKEENTSPTDELSLYLASPLASLKNNPLEKWESMKMQYPSLYTLAVKYLSIVATSLSAERLFTETGIETVQLRSRLIGKRLNKQLFLNSVNKEYWFPEIADVRSRY